MSSEAPADAAVVLQARGLGKCYRSFASPLDRLRQALFGGPSRHQQEFWALRDATFTLRRGEALGLIGRNGSGKSTLLQILAGTLPPSAGSGEVHGRVGALLELGSGFDPEFTGRENVRLQGVLLGFTPAEVEAQLPAIEAFAEIGAFLDQPVRTYSSGMFVRLAFAVQVMLVPEVLIVDEALAVGDAPFQIKCMNHMRKLLASGTAVIFASHDMEAVRSLCSQVLWIHQGEVKQLGDPHSVTTAYLRFLFGGDRSVAPAPTATAAPRRTGPGDGSARHPLPPLDRPDLLRWGRGDCRITHARLATVDDPEPVPVALRFANGSRLQLAFEYVATTPIAGTGLCASFTIRNTKALNVATFVTHENGHALPDLPAGGRARVTFAFDLPLSRGDYSIAMSVEQVLPDERLYLDFVENAFHFQVVDERPPFAVLTLPFACTVTPGDG